MHHIFYEKNTNLMAPTITCNLIIQIPNTNYSDTIILCPTLTSSNIQY